MYIHPAWCVVASLIHWMPEPCVQEKPVLLRMVKSAQRGPCMRSHALFCPPPWLKHREILGTPQATPGPRANLGVPVDTPSGSAGLGPLFDRWLQRCAAYTKQVHGEAVAHFASLRGGQQPEMSDSEGEWQNEAEITKLYSLQLSIDMPLMPYCGFAAFAQLSVRVAAFCPCSLWL